MSNWSLDFSLMVPPPLFWAGVALAVLLVLVLLVRRTRGALLRALSLAALLLGARQPHPAPGGTREPRQHRHRRHRREPQPVDRGAARADRRHQARARDPARRHPQPAGALGQLLAADRRERRGHDAVRRPQRRARQHAAGPARRRHHGHRRAGPRRAEVGAGAGLRCARARAARPAPPASSTAASRSSRHRATASSAPPRDRAQGRRDRPQGPRQRARGAQDPARGQPGHHRARR